MMKIKRSWQSHLPRTLQLQSLAIRFKVCRSHIPISGKSNILQANRSRHGGICWWYACQEYKRRMIFGWSQGKFWDRKMKLNLMKCGFCISFRTFPESMVSQWGIKANQEKVGAIIEMTSPKSVKEVQSLTRKLAALNWFISKVINKCLHFFEALRKAFKWISECEQTFKELEDYLSKQGEELFLYLAIS